MVVSKHNVFLFLKPRAWVFFRISISRQPFFGGNWFFWKIGWFTVVMALGRMYDLAYYELGELISRSILIFSLNKVYTITRTRSWAMSWYMVCLCYLWRSSSIKLPQNKVYVSYQMDSIWVSYIKIIVSSRSKWRWYWLGQIIIDRGNLTRITFVEHIPWF